MIEVPPTIFRLLFCPDLIKNVFNLHFFDENENLDRLHNLIEMERERALLEKWGGGGCFLEI